MSLLLKNGQAFYQDRLQNLDILTQNDKIAQIGPNLSGANAKKVDLTGKVVIPGCIDMHVHFREPGGEHKEDWTTGSLAAAKGGVTTVCAMPNTNPAITTIKLYKANVELASPKSYVNFIINFGAGPDNHEEQSQLPLAIPVKCYAGPTTGSLLVDQPEILAAIFSATDHLFLIHAEDKAEMDNNAEQFAGSEDPTVHNKIRTPRSATIVIERILAIVRKTGRRAHFCHISSHQELELIKQAKQEGLPITCEVTPHHLFLEEEALSRLGNYAKMNPPIRSQEHLDALWQGLVNGDIDCVATDHAPHTRQEKDQPYSQAPAGVPGVETMLPLLLDQVNQDKLTLSRLVEVTSSAPARLLGLPAKGKIEEGFDADLTILDLRQEKQILNSSIVSKCGWTPFDGTSCQGWPVMTIVNGQIVYGDQTEQEPVGRSLVMI